MIPRLWYLKRAVPWLAVLGCLAVAAPFAAAARTWETLDGLSVLSAVLLVAAAACFVYDEPALAVAAVMPRGGRWASSARLGAVAVPVLAGVATAWAVRGRFEVGAWTLVVVATSLAVAAVALLGSRRGLARPGVPIASAVVLLGLLPLPVEHWLDVRAPFPDPGLATEAAALWTGVGCCAAATLAVLVLRPAPLRLDGRADPS